MFNIKFCFYGNFRTFYEGNYCANQFLSDMRILHMLDHYRILMAEIIQRIVKSLSNFAKV